MFSIERVQEEIAYIAPKIVAAGTVNLHIADTNFGMFPRDRDICESLKLAHDTHGWPRQIMSTTGKNNKERVIDITNIMGTIFSVNMSVQSMDKTVLSNIRRQNIQLDDFIRINRHLQESGRTTKGELIMGMPGESKESFLNGVEQMIDAKVSFVCIYTLMLLTGTEFKNPEYLLKHGIKGKYRVVPLNFGQYAGSNT
jgi:tRNA A37 methylthiotransferase MiaB